MQTSHLSHLSFTKQTPLIEETFIYNHSNSGGKKHMEALVEMYESLIQFLSGGESEMLKILVSIMVVDVITGLLKGVKRRNIKSIIMSMGLLKKGGMLTAIYFAGQLGSLPIADGVGVAYLFIILFIGNEALSVAENLEALGVPFPEQIKRIIASMADEENPRLEDRLKANEDKKDPTPIKDYMGKDNNEYNNNEEEKQ